MDGATVTIWEKENEKVGEKEALNVLSALRGDGWEMQKEEKDSLITDNKKLQKLKNILNQLGALGRSPSSSPSI